MALRESFGGADDRLRKRYQDLVQIRETQPEREAAAACEALEKNRSASDALIASLREQVALAKENQSLQRSTTAQCPTAVEQQLRAETDELKRQLADARLALQQQRGSDADIHKIAFYELMTGMRVECDGPNNVTRCVISAQNGTSQTASASFEIHTEPADGDPGDIEYVPTNIDGCAERLPEYMQDALICAFKHHRPLACQPCETCIATQPRPCVLPTAASVSCTLRSRGFTGPGFLPQDSARRYFRVTTRHCTPLDNLSAALSHHSS